MHFVFASFCLPPCHVRHVAKQLRARPVVEAPPGGPGRASADACRGSLRPRPTRRGTDTARPEPAPSGEAAAPAAALAAGAPHRAFRSERRRLPEGGVARSRRLGRDGGHVPFRGARGFRPSRPQHVPTPPARAPRGATNGTPARGPPGDGGAEYADPIVPPDRDGHGEGARRLGSHRRCNRPPPTTVDRPRRPAQVPSTTSSWRRAAHRCASPASPRN